MKYRRDYQATHDIDWFFRYKGRVYHAASNGGMLPDVVDSKKNRELQERLEVIEGAFQVEFINRNQNFYNQNEDLSSFEEYAARGFISLDRIEDDDNEGNNMRDVQERATTRYRVVASPVNGSFFDEDLLSLMPELDEDDIEIL